MPWTEIAQPLPGQALILALASSIVLSAFHALSPVLRKVPDRHLATLNSVAGGIGLSYVFLYLLFELITEGAAKIHTLIPLGPAPLETLFIILLGAVTVTYSMQMAHEATPDVRDDHRNFATLFLAYGLLAGFGAVEEADWGLLNVAFYVIAIGIHLAFNDFFLLHHYPEAHTAPWRLALALSPTAGCGAALAVGLPTEALYIALTFVAGGTITIIFQRELPEHRRFRPAAFVAGVTAYAALIFATWRF